MKDNRFSFQKIYRKSQISYSFFEKIAIEVECFLQNLTKNHETCKAYFETLGPSVVLWSSEILANNDLILICKSTSELGTNALKVYLQYNR